MKLPTNGAYTFRQLQEATESRKEKFPDLIFPEKALERDKWLAELIEHKKKIVRQVRKQEEIPVERIVQAFLMLVFFASSRKICVQEVITKGYPGKCVYCGDCPCTCTNPGVPRPLFRMKGNHPPKLKQSFGAFQASDWRVYPNDRSFEAKLIRALHLSEEGDEWTIEFLRNSEEKKIVEEMGDFLERLISLASTFEINLAREVAYFFNRHAK